MLDIVESLQGFDLGMADTVVMKAGNVLSIQLGSLEYAPGFGVDQRFFLQDSLQFQNESFKSYLVEMLIQNQINTSEITETLETFVSKYSFSVGQSNLQSKGFIL